jgi:hypothetical protein
LDELEDSFVHGYFDGQPTPWPALRIYQAQTALTHWAALVHQQQSERRVRSAMRLAVSSRLFESYINDRLRKCESREIFP